MYINVNSKPPPNTIRNLPDSIFHAPNYQLMKRSLVSQKTCRIIPFSKSRFKDKIHFHPKDDIPGRRKNNSRKKKKYFMDYNGTDTGEFFFFLIVF